MSTRIKRENIENPAPGIYLRGFYPDNDVTKKFLVDVMSNLNVGNKKIVVTSVFPRRTYLERAFTSITARTTHFLPADSRQRISYGHIRPVEESNVINIWYSGENSRIPSSDGWDAYLSCEADASIDGAIFLPFWATRFGETLKYADLEQEKYKLTRDLDITKKQGICAVIGNPEPFRLNFIKHLNRIIPVEVFGTITGNRVPDKLELLKKYKMNVCFENDLYPNYVTEKPFEAWYAGAIPIWWGIDKSSYLNPNAMIQVFDGSFQDSLNLIENIYFDDQVAKSMISQNLLNKSFDFNEMYTTLQNRVGS
jgi:hypothetical protein